MPTRLLVVDDHPPVLLALSEALQRHLNETVIDTALSTTSALSLLRDHAYHAVLSDVRMGGMDGVTLLNQIRERWPDTPVVMMTAAGTGREAEALMSGAVAFVEKPVDIDRLVAILNPAMEKSVMRQRVGEANRRSLAHLQLEAGRLGLSLDPSQNDPS
jgi:DNA-binding NtrC family response regulator